MDFTDRVTGGAPPGSADNVTEYDLIFSVDNIFGNGDDTVVNVLSPLFANTDSVLINGGLGIEAQFLRFDVLSTNGANPGAAEFAFFTTLLPEPTSVLLWTLLGVGLVSSSLVFRRRKSN